MAPYFSIQYIMLDNYTFHPPPPPPTHTHTQITNSRCKSLILWSLRNSPGTIFSTVSSHASRYYSNQCRLHYEELCVHTYVCTSTTVDCLIVDSLKSIQGKIFSTKDMRSYGMYLTTLHTCTSLLYTLVPHYSTHWYLTTLHPCTSLLYTLVPHYSTPLYLTTLHACTSLLYTLVPHYSTRL